MKKSADFLAKFFKDESGISSVEYALLLAFVGAGIVAGATALSGAVSGEMSAAASCVTGGTTSSC